LCRLQATEAHREVVTGAVEGNQDCYWAVQRGGGGHDAAKADARLGGGR
jgi:hypothetical protein